MIVVLDASAAIEMALNREDGLRFRKFLTEAELILVPDTYPSEIINTFWKYGVFAKLSTEICEKGIDFCLDIIDKYIDSRKLYREVFAESIKMRHPAYDMFYLVLARRHNACILTKDQKMINLANELKITVF